MCERGLLHRGGTGAEDWGGAVRVGARRKGDGLLLGVVGGDEHAGPGGRGRSGSGVVTAVVRH